MRHKNKFLAWVMAGIIIMGLTGCAAAEENEIVPQDNSGYENSESETEITSDKAPAVVTTAMPVATMSTTTTEQTTTTTVIEEISTATEIPVTEETYVATETEEISTEMTDEEINNLAIKRADELYELFQEFLVHNENDLPFSYDIEETRGVFISKNGDEYDIPFNIIRHDTIKTYDDLFALFIKTCTMEYSTYLLKYFSNQYTDINGKLAFCESYLVKGPLEYENLKYISYDIVNKDEIKLNFTADSFIIYTPDGVWERNELPDVNYSIYLNNINGEWLISNCVDDSGFYAEDIHGYNWIVS